MISAEAFRNIKAVVLDVDGVLTDGRAGYGAEEEIKKTLTAQGCSEIITYSFISPKDYEFIRQAGELEKAIKIKNPIGEDMSVMRTTLIPSMLATLVRNVRRGNEGARLYELASVYLAESLPLTAQPQERKTLCIGVYGEGEDFYTAKGLFECLAAQSGIRFEYFPVTDYKPIPIGAIKIRYDRSLRKFQTVHCPFIPCLYSLCTIAEFHILWIRISFTILLHLFSYSIMDHTIKLVLNAGFLVIMLSFTGGLSILLMVNYFRLYTGVFSIFIYFRYFYRCQCHKMHKLSPFYIKWRQGRQPKIRSSTLSDSLYYNILYSFTIFKNLL